jgi:hypothetical protein
LLLLSATLKPSPFLLLVGVATASAQAVKTSCSGRGARDWSKLANPSAYIMSIISQYIRKGR